MINNKNINLNFLLDWRMWALIIIGTYSLFSVSKLNKSMTHRYKDKYFKYTITCTNENGHSYPIFKTAINNREKAQDFADTLGYELSKENPTVDMKFKEK